MATEPTLDVLPSDICIATSAAPIFLPAHYFTKQDEQGKVIKEFNLIDGSVAANNPNNTLKGDLASADVATKENLDNLVKVGQQLLGESRYGSV
ncbi:hypothetical protein JHK86_002203 [Glycine max]|nr:hypothetical protein JHK86_002203 [Glycine max]